MGARVMAGEETKPERKDARTNPWYVLMTIAGEQEGSLPESDLHARNRRHWNGWAGAALSDEQKADLIGKHGFTKEDFAPLTEEETAEIRSQLRDRAGTNEIPDPRSLIILSNLEFAKMVCCDHFVFGDVLFDKAKFNLAVHFERTIFFGCAFFVTVKFIGKVNFEGVAFSREAHFRHSDFSGGAEFASATFSQAVYFDCAEIDGTVNFSDGRFNGPARFSDMRLREDATPPLLYNATLHENTDWNVAEWPPVPDDPDRARFHLRAYERLKLLMSDQKKHADEHMFLRKELACREVVEESRMLRWGYRLFRLTCDSGWDPVRPLQVLAAAWAIGAVLFWGLEMQEHRAMLAACTPAPDPMTEACRQAEPLSVAQAAGLSLSNLFAFLGMGFHIMRDEILSLTGPSEVVAGIQLFLGPVMLFLAALAFRNRFRLG
jgi:uncharacterized protein YjbI with pentapeptide repeats